MSAESRSFAGGLGLDSSECRVLGCLLEKQLTTPDMYPLTLNGLRLACNQSTNRDPVVDYDEAILRNALHRLERRGFARLASGRGSRAPKYRHLLADALPLTREEHAILCVLLLRGAQTPGELKQRAERMHAFSGLDAVHDTLDRLAGRELVACMKRRPGQKEERYVQLLEDHEPTGTSNGRELDEATPGSSGSHGIGGEVRPVGPEAEVTVPTDLMAAFARLQERVAGLEHAVEELRAALDTPNGAAASALQGGGAPEMALPDQATQEWS